MNYSTIIPTTVPKFPIDLHAISLKLYTVHSQNLETSFVAALQRHLGYCPTLDEARCHVKILPLGEGMRRWLWDETVLMEERPAVQEDGKFNLPEIVVV